MSGVAVPPWRSRVYLASGKLENKSIASFQACTRQVRFTPNCSRIAAAQQMTFRANRRHRGVGRSSPSPTMPSVQAARSIRRSISLRSVTKSIGLGQKRLRHSQTRSAFRLRIAIRGDHDDRYIPRGQLTRGSYADGLFDSRAPASVLLFATRRFRWQDINEPRAAKVIPGKGA